MPVNTRHPAFEQHYERCETTENAVTGCVHDYVPPLAGQSQRSYDAYVSRAAYYNVTDRTLQALLGALLRKPYVLENVAHEEPFTDSLSFPEFLQSCYSELLQSGRVGVLVEFDDALNSPKLVLYRACNIINWSSRFIVLEETHLVSDPDDEYKLINETTWRELRLNDEGLYEVRIFKQEGRDIKLVDVIEPVIRGKRIDYVPFYWVNPRDNTPQVLNPPLFNLATLNIQHFRTAVDYAHGLHFLALPTPYITGDVFSVDGMAPKQINIGSENFLHLVQGSTAGFLEFSGNGLNAIHTQLTHIEEQMFQAGSRLLTNKTGVESAEALRLRAGSENASLNSLASALENGLQAALTTYNEWAGSSIEPVVTLNRDFNESKLDPSELSSLLQAYAAGVITLETLLTKLFEGEIVADPQAEAAALAAAPEPAQEQTPVQ